MGKIRKEEKVLSIETVHQCNCCMGCQTLHPLVSVIDLSKANLEQHTIKFDFYTIILVEGQPDIFQFGRKHYDYSNASLVFLTPGESLKIELYKALLSRGRLLAFHPELICRTSLKDNLKNYSFFFYKPDEALHLSLREKIKVADCMCNIKEELQHAIDCHTKVLISRYIELLLDYCTRFYERQFITRNEANKRIINETDLLLNKSILSGEFKNGILPLAEYCAEILQLSPCYFRDLLKFETGKSINEYFQEKRLDISKKMLLDPNITVSMVANKLGYSNVQSFSYLFKKITGVAPGDWAFQNN